MEELASTEVEVEDEEEEEEEEWEKEARRAGASTWEHPMRYPPAHQRASLALPTSLPEIPSAVSPLPGDPLTPHSKAKANWKKAFHGTLDRQPFNFEMDVFSGSEPQTPTHGKHVMFEEGVHQTSRMDNYSHRRNRRARRRRSTRSVYLRDGETHAVWKPGTKQSSVHSSNPATPSPPPGSFADVVKLLMKQKHDLRERQRKLTSRVTATQAVLKEQNEELATVAEENEEEDDEDEKKEMGSDDAARSDTPSKRMWRKACNTIIDTSKGTESYKNKKERKRSTLHFHKVVTNKMATMEPGGAATRFHSTSDNDGVTPPPISPKVAQKFRRNASLSHTRRAGAITPSGAIPFTQWKSQYFQRQRLTRQEAMKHFRSNYNINPQYGEHSLPRYCSDDNLHLPGRRASSIHRVDDLEPPRSKSVSQSRYLRRCSSPDILGLDDRDDLSDASVPLDDMLSPSAISSRSNSPAVFSDEEERRSKLRTRTPVDEGLSGAKVHTRAPLTKQDSAELHSPGPLTNIKKRAQKRNQNRQMYTDSVIEADIEADNVPLQPTGPKTTSALKETHPPVGPRRPKRVSLSLPTSPRATPSPRPLSPIQSLGSPQSPSPRPSPAQIKRRKHGIGVTSPADLNERISREQWRRDSMQHISPMTSSPENIATGEYVDRSHSVSPSHASQYNRIAQRRSSSPLELDLVTHLQRERKVSSPSPTLLVQNPPSGANISQWGGHVKYSRGISQTSVGSAVAPTSSGRVHSPPPPGVGKVPLTRI